MNASLEAGALAVTIRRVNPLEDAGWDAKLVDWPAASFFHSAAWARVLHSTYGFTPVYFLQSQGNQLQALLPVMEVDSWLTGRRGIALPFTDDCEPLCRDAVAFSELFQAALSWAKTRAWKYLECRGGKTLLAEAPASTAYYGHRLSLAGNEETLFAMADSSVRRAIRKAEKNGVSTAVSQELDAVRLFYDLLCKTRKKHGLPPQPIQFFQNLYEHIFARNHGFVVLAQRERTPIAGAVFVHFGRRAIYKYGASDASFQDLRANNLVMWEAIKWYTRNGFRDLHFGRTSLNNDGLRRFKLGWGTEEHLIEYVRHDCRAGKFVTVKDDAAGWHNQVFRMMPSALSRLVGTVLYQHVA